MKISYECGEIITELKRDIIEFGADEPAYGIWETRKVKVPFQDRYVETNLLVNYLTGDEDPEGYYNPGEVAILSTLGELLPIFEEENRIF